MKMKSNIPVFMSNMKRDRKGTDTNAFLFAGFIPLIECLRPRKKKLTVFSAFSS